MYWDAREPPRQLLRAPKPQLFKLKLTNDCVDFVRRSHNGTKRSAIECIAATGVVISLGENSEGRALTLSKVAPISLLPRMLLFPYVHAHRLAWDVFVRM